IPPWIIVWWALLYECCINPSFVVWTREGEQFFRKLKDKLTKAPSLALLGILVQEHGVMQRPGVYFSRMIDSVAKEWPYCLQNCTATVLMVTEAKTDHRRIPCCQGPTTGQDITS
uniref:Uncharacterized protein n=1 Tax=Nothoprocta perdicaria TaxID=30464 RepID=A0A8C6ZXT5_NOTPE